VFVIYKADYSAEFQIAKHPFSPIGRAYRLSLINSCAAWYAVAVSIEAPGLDAHSNKLIYESQKLAYQLGGDPEVLDGYLFALLQAVLDAVETKLSREEIEAALRQGLHQGELQCADPSLTPEYWEAVRSDGM
jgi:hypothetical protein